MGTAVIFLVILDALILVGPYSELRLAIALTTTIVVAIVIGLIWRKNSALEKLGRD